MIHSLLFFTNEYPYNRGDSCFIKYEIPFLSRIFNKIHIVPLNIGSDSKEDILDTPENVTVHIMKSNNKKLKKIILLFNLIFYSRLYAEILLLIKTKKISLKTLYISISFLAEAVLIEKFSKKLLEKYKDICLIYSYWYWYSAMAALFLKKSYVVKCVTRTHEYDLYEYKNYQPYKSWMDIKLDKIFFISKNGYDYYMNNFALCGPEKYSLSYLGINNYYKNPVQNTYKSGNYKVLLSCAYICPRKRIHLIAEALSEIENINIHWIHIGNGIIENNIYLLAKKLLNKKSNISYEFKGYMENENIMRFYSENIIDCFISASESEGLPVSMMEAISFGIPVIATNAGGVSEIVNDNTGILLNSEGNVREIRNAMEIVFSYSGNKKEELKYSSMKFWKENFNAEINYSKFTNELLDTVNSKSFSQNNGIA